jgi:hypothetical protein
VRLHSPGTPDAGFPPVERRNPGGVSEICTFSLILHDLLLHGFRLVVVDDRDRIGEARVDAINAI